MKLGISSGIYEQYFHTNIGEIISPRLSGSQNGWMIFFEFDVFHNVIHTN